MNNMKKLLPTITALLAILTAPAFANAPMSTQAKQAIVIDNQTGQVLFEKNAVLFNDTSSLYISSHNEPQVLCYQCIDLKSHH